MTVAIDCKECGAEVVFWIKEQTKRPTETCECGVTYRLKIEKVIK